MQAQIPVFIGSNVFQDLVEYLRQAEPQQFLLVADDNTDHACGQLLEQHIRLAGLSLTKLVLSGQPRVVPDETSIVRVLQALNGQEQTLIAVGSGTITDIVRFVCCQARLPFISVPTAASVDAYTSYTAALSIGRGKQSFLAKPACGVFAHLPTICAAPRRMTAAGFGDMVAKYTALADWKIAHLITDDDYEETIAQQAAQALKVCVEQADEIGSATAAGVFVLMQSLFTSGFCMVAVKSSRPAAGAEHSLAHFWEIKHHQQHLPETLHGEKTGVAAVLISRLYEKLRGLSRDEASQKLAHFRLPDPAEEIIGIREAYGEAADQIITNRPSLLGKTDEKIERIQRRLIENWDEIQSVAHQVPGPDDVISLLKRGGAPTGIADIQVNEKEAAQALRYGMYVRDRLTILELAYLLNLG